MKKSLTFVLLVVLCLNLAVVALADPIEADESFTVDGWIGIQSPDVTMIQVDLPAGNALAWAADETSSGAVYSATYAITNQSDFADLKVTLVSFEQDNTTTNTHASTVASDLTLTLTGSLAVPSSPNFANDWTAGHTYTNLLKADDGATGGLDEWQFGFGGVFSGSFPSTTPWTPEYDMVLNFAIN